MSYFDVLQWAAVDFERLVAVAPARDYRPEWIAHQLEERGHEMTPAQATVFERMIANAGPYLSRRERWVLWQVKAKPTCVEALARLAKGTAEYRSYKDLARCVGNDVARLVERGLIKTHVGVIDDAGGSGGAAMASTPRG